MTIFFAKKTKMGDGRGKSGEVRVERHGRTEARPIGANENPQRIFDTMWMLICSDLLRYAKPDFRLAKSPT